MISCDSGKVVGSAVQLTNHLIEMGNAVCVCMCVPVVIPSIREASPHLSVNMSESDEVGHAGARSHTICFSSPPFCQKPDENINTEEIDRNKVIGFISLSDLHG